MKQRKVLVGHALALNAAQRQFDLAIEGDSSATYVPIILSSKSLAAAAPIRTMARSLLVAAANLIRIRHRD